MKYFIFSFFLLIFQAAFSQDTYVCKNGYAHFFSEAPMEDIEATSHLAVSVIDVEAKRIYSKVPIRSFQFEKKLMQEHFNENYMESERFPYGILDATFSEEIDFEKDGEHSISLNGELELHGIKKQRTIPGKIKIENGKLSGSAAFQVALKEHGIKIPKLVIKNIAETVKVTVAFEYTAHGE